MSFCVIVDPGHGGRNRGTESLGMAEKENNLDMAERIGVLLEQTHADVWLTRYHDEDLGFRERGDIADQFDADLYISIHVNANKDSSVHGAQIYYNGEDRGMRGLAEYAWSVLPLPLKTHPDKILDVSKDWRGDWIESPRNVLSAYSPSLLFELGHGTNNHDFTYLRSRLGKDRISNWIVNAVLKYAEMLKGVYG